MQIKTPGSVVVVGRRRFAESAMGASGSLPAEQHTPAPVVKEVPDFKNLIPALKGLVPSEIPSSDERGKPFTLQVHSALDGLINTNIQLCPKLMTILRTADGYGALAPVVDLYQAQATRLPHQEIKSGYVV